MPGRLNLLIRLSVGIAATAVLVHYVVVHYGLDHSLRQVSNQSGNKQVTLSPARDCKGWLNSKPTSVIYNFGGNLSIYDPHELIGCLNTTEGSSTKNAITELQVVLDPPGWSESYSERYERYERYDEQGEAPGMMTVIEMLPNLTRIRYKFTFIFILIHAEPRIQQMAA